MSQEAYLWWSRPRRSGCAPASSPVRIFFFFVFFFTLLSLNTSDYTQHWNCLCFVVFLTTSLFFSFFSFFYARTTQYRPHGLRPVPRVNKNKAPPPPTTWSLLILLLLLLLLKVKEKKKTLSSSCIHVAYTHSSVCSFWVLTFFIFWLHAYVYTK